MHTFFIFAIRFTILSKDYSYLHDLQLSDDISDNSPKQVDILLGLNFYFDFITGKTKIDSPNLPKATESLLGWVVCGPNLNQNSNYNSNVNLLSHILFG